MGQYRKKPVAIEAFLFGVDARPDWFQDKVTTNEIVTGELLSMPGRPYCDIQTLEGTMRGNYGDYIIKGIKGEIYPCKPDIFEATYDLHEPRESPINPVIENNFRYHSPKLGQPEKYTAIREKAKEFAVLVDELAPNSREKSLAMTNLEQSVMWANAAIARNE